MERTTISDSTSTTFEQPRETAPVYTARQAETPFSPSAQPVGQNYSISSQPAGQPSPYPQYVLPTVFSKYPQPITCPNCKASAMSTVNFETGLATYLATAAGCVFCACFGLIACCIDDLKDVEHYCPNCGMLVGLKKLIS
jgi:rubredoxin